MHKAYQIALLYFLLFSVLLLLSGGLIFYDKIGFDAVSLRNYYLGDEALFMMPKSFFGVLKVLLAHLFSFGLFSFVILHFLRFITPFKGLGLLSITTLVVALLEVLSSFLILVWEGFVYLKLITFFGFFSLMLLLFFILLRSILIEQ